jgi:hypothetical protein
VAPPTFALIGVMRLFGCQRQLPSNSLGREYHQELHLSLDGYPLKFFSRENAAISAFFVRLFTAVI